MGIDPASLPRAETAEGRRVCEALFWAPSTIEPLAGEIDSTFLVADAAGDRYVLKVASLAAERPLLELQEHVLSRLESVDVGRFPRLVASRHGRTLEEVEIGGSVRLARMLTYLPGHLMADLPARPPALLASLGRLLGRVDRTLADLDEPAARRYLQWDLARLEAMEGLAESIRDPQARRLVEQTIERYVERRRTLAPGLRRGLIHNDANDRNILVSSLDPEAARLAGLIDFGDLVESDWVAELAVAMAYAGLGCSDPWSTALPILGGYHRENPLSGEELEMLLPAVSARLALSVSVSARRVVTGLADEYALVSEAPAWEALRLLAELDADVAASAAQLLTVGVPCRV